MLAARLQAIGGARTFTLQDSQHCRLLLTARYFSSCPSDSILRYSLDGHPALQSTASSGSSSALAVSSFRLRARLDVCIPSAFSGQRGITPACWIWRPSFERQRDFNPPEQRAAQHALWVRKTARHPSRRLWSPLGSGTSLVRSVPMVRRRWGALFGSWTIPLEACPELRTPATPARPRDNGRCRMLPSAWGESVGIATMGDFGADLHGLSSLLCTLRTHQSPDEWQHSLLACLLDFSQAGLAPAGLQ